MIKVRMVRITTAGGTLLLSIIDARLASALRALRKPVVGR